MSRKGLNIYKRKDNRWEGRYPKGRREDGSLIYGYIYGKTYSSVKESIIRLRNEYNENKIYSNNTYEGTVQEWCGIWLEKYVAPNVKQSTHGSYQHKLQTYIYPFLGDKNIQKLTSKDIQEWIYMQNKTLSPSSVKVVFRLINSSLEIARKKGIVLENPCEHCTLAKDFPKKPKAFSVIQQQLIIQKADKDNYLEVIIALETGMRIGEVCALKWSDICFNERYLCVNRTRQRIVKNTGKGTMIIEETPKTTKSNRIIPLSESLITRLRKAKKVSKSQYVIANGQRPFEPRTLTKKFNKFLYSLEITGYSFHSLRHTFATRCVESGVNIVTISDLLGHQSVQTTIDIYATTFMSEKRNAIKKISHFTLT